MQTKNWVLGLVAAALILVATSAALDLYPGLSPTKGLATAPAAPPSTPSLAPGPTPNYRAIFQIAAPAVVGITVAGQLTLGSGEMQPDLNDPFFQFFRGLPGFQLPIPQHIPGSKVPFRSQGSGFIIASDGLVLTNAHVVREAKEVLVKLNDRREFKATVLGTDPATDLAVLRINANHLPTVRLGDSEQLQVGDPVLAIGSPFGFEQSASQGIVSAKGRSLPGDSAVPFIQTDAAVNPGNSGGPLFDASGAVVGINAQIYSRSGGFQGLSFAIPMAVALKVKDQIVASGHASHARLGVTVQDLGQSLAQSFGLQKPAGALISSVQPQSAAAAAGLQPGDIVIAINGEAIERPGDLSSRISQQAPGNTVQLTIWRNNKARPIVVKLGSADDRTSEKAPADQDTKPGELGLSLRTLRREEMSGNRLPDGLLIEDVRGPAAKAGLEPGDVLLSINGFAVHSTDQVRHLLDSKPKQLALLIWRDGSQLFVPLALE